MAGGGLWRKTLVYFGLADEDDEYYDDLPSVRRDEEPSYRDSYRDRDRDRDRDREPDRDRDGDRDRDRAKVRRIPERDSRSRRSSSDFDEIFTEGGYREERPSGYGQQRGGATPLRPVPSGMDQAQVKVQLVVPRSFNDAQTIADKYKNDIPVILNLQQSETELAKRLIDFASGLTYALDGGMQRVADKVFLLTPRNVEVSAEERQRIMDRGFFNQY
jgi:cell division inhibitor SepF